MARLEAVAKLLFYPTPDPVTELLIRSIRLEFAGGTLLDMCAGDGRPAAALCKAWGLQSYGIELDGQRAAAAAAVMDVVRRGSYHQLQDAHAFSVLFLNPPYDEGVDVDGKSMRQEVLFLRAATGFLANDGLLVYIVPRRLLKDKKLHAVLGKSYRDVQVFRFPDPEAQAFDQVVIVARRYFSRDLYGFYGSCEALERDAPVLGTAPYESDTAVPSTTITGFELVGKPPEDFAPRNDPDAPTGVFASTRWALLTSESDLAAERPLVAPRPGHQAMLLAAGRLNGVEIAGNLMKGGSSKVKIKINKPGEIVERERIVSHLSTLSLTTGEFETWRVDEEQERTAQWFKAHGDDLARAIMASHTPTFDGKLDRYDFSTVRAPGILPGRDKPELLEIQKEASAAVVHGWRTRKTVILCGEQGTGKTTMATAATTLTVVGATAKLRKVVVICPSHLVPKWIGECNTITGIKGVARTAAKVSDVDAFFADPVARYLVLSKERAKLGMRWRAAYQIRRRFVDVERSVQQDRWSRPETVIDRRLMSFATCPSCGTSMSVSSLGNEQRYNCHECSGALWTSVPLSEKGTVRWPLASHISRHFARRFVLVIDEAHQHAGAESDQGRAVQVLAAASLKILAMTGTLYGGRAKPIFHLLYRIDHAFRESYEHDECAKFVAHHGLFETIHKIEESTTTFNRRRGNSGGRVHEIPGMSPAMVAMLLPYTIFVKLKDLRIELPSYAEEVEIVRHDPEVEAEAKRFADEILKVIHEQPRVLGAYVQACLGYPDRPDQAERIEGTDEDGDPVLVAEARAFPDQFWPKDLRVAEICAAERDAGRKSLVFFSQTKRRDARQRVRRALEARGLRVEVLESSVEPSKRIEWINAAEARGFDVLLTNGKLVETGMDLLWAHTIIWFGTEYSLSVLRQASRRSWRLGQINPIRVIFMAYADTMQAAAIDLIARKNRAAELIDGDEAGGLSQHDVGGNDFLVELAHTAIEQQSKRMRRVRAA